MNNPMDAALPIEAAWEKYKEEVIPQNAPEVQFKECRNAFYAGAMVTVNMLCRAAMGDNVSILSKIEENLTAFKVEVLTEAVTFADNVLRTARHPCMFVCDSDQEKKDAVG